MDPVTPCEVCGNTNIRHLFEKAGYPYQLCADCGLIRIHPQLSDEALEEIYNRGTYYINSAGNEHVIRIIKEATFKGILNLLPDNLPEKTKFLDVGASIGIMMELAEKKGLDAYGIEASEEAAGVIASKFGSDRVFCGYFDEKFEYWEPCSFDVICMSDLFEHLRDPNTSLQKVRSLLRNGGYALLFLPDTESLSRKIMGRNWSYFIPEHLYSYSRNNIRVILERNGFSVVALRSAPKYLTASFAACILESYGGFIDRLGARFFRMWPTRIASHPFAMRGVQMAVLAQKINK